MGVSGYSDMLQNAQFYVAKMTVRLRLARSQLRGRRCRLERGVVSRCCSREPAVWRPHSHSPRCGKDWESESQLARDHTFTNVPAPTPQSLAPSQQHTMGVKETQESPNCDPARLQKIEPVRLYRG